MCKRYAVAKQNLDAALSMKTNANADPSVAANLDRKLGELQDLVKRGEAHCANTDPVGQTLHTYQAVLAAAELGDASAVECYLDGGAVGDFYQQSPEIQEDFRANATEIAQKAIRNGDWFVVFQLATAYSGAASQYDTGQWLQQALRPDPVLAYQYRLLYRRGLQGTAALSMDDQLANQRLQNRISDEQARQAQAWADRTYTHYFNRAPLIDSDTHEVCGER